MRISVSSYLRNIKEIELWDLEINEVIEDGW